MALVGIDARFIYRHRWSGLSYYIYNLLGRMVDLSPHRFRLYYETEPARKPFSGEERITERKITIRGSRFHAWEQVALPWYQARDKVELFHGPANYLPFIQPCPTVLTLHDMILSRHDENESANELFYWRKVMPHCIRKAERVITDSECSKRDIVNILGVNEQKVRVVYAGVDEFYRPMTAAELNEQAGRQSLPDEFVLVLGGASPRKNVSRAFEAFALLKKRSDTAVKLVVTIPNETDRGQWTRRMAECGLHDEVVLLEKVSRELLRHLYNRASLFVYPSLYEGFGLPLIEAMACGAPVATSNASCLPEVAGDAAVLFDPCSPADIASAMEKVRSDSALALRLHERGFARAKQFSWSKAAAETLQVYDEILS